MTDWHIRGRILTTARPLVMGILNVTPDSFSDGGRFASEADVVTHAIALLDGGADILDVGGESTRPGAAPVSEGDELRRVLPVIRRLAAERPDAVISVDTVKSGVARAALDAGAHIVNDVSGMRLDPGISTVCAAAGAGLVVMHSRGASVAELASYAHASYGDDVVGEVLAELRRRVDSALHAGIAREAIAVDPGIGFSKRTEHSLALLAGLPRLVGWGFPVVCAVSRKRFIGEISGVAEPGARLGGTLGANVAALALGARIFRVHDVRPAREALDVAWEILRNR